MNLLSKQELNSLLNCSEKYCLSIYMPTEKAGPRTRQNPIRFKNLVNEAEEKLRSAGLTASDADKFLREAKAMIEDDDFWLNQDSGLACFISSQKMHSYTLPHSFPELVVVSDHFHLKPLLPLITRDNKFYLLALAQNQIRLFQGNRYDIQELPLPEGVPASLDEALRYDELEKQLQFHSAQSDRQFLYHGHGAGTTDNKEEIQRYFQQVEHGLKPLLQEQQAPLILAGVEYLLPIYQQANSYGNLLQEGIKGNPENVSPKELHQKAWSVIQAHFDQAKKEAMARYQELVSSKQASADLKKIVPAAYHGKVDTLFVATGVEYWGKFEPENNSVQIDDRATPENYDLLNFAAIQTFVQGGNFYQISPEQMPNAEPVAAIFRYPVSANTSTSKV